VQHQRHNLLSAHPTSIFHPARSDHPTPNFLDTYVLSLPATCLSRISKLTSRFDWRWRFTGVGTRTASTRTHSYTQLEHSVQKEDKVSYEDTQPMVHTQPTVLCGGLSIIFYHATSQTRRTSTCHNSTRQRHRLLPYFVVGIYSSRKRNAPAASTNTSTQAYRRDVEVINAQYVALKQCILSLLRRRFRNYRTLKI
jgi:hypothetical protein